MQTRAVYQRRGVIGQVTDQPEDWEAAYMWRVFGYVDVKEEDMREGSI